MYATNEMIDKVLSSRKSYVSQFKQELTSEEILSIASDNFYAGASFALDELKIILEASLGDYDKILEAIQPIIDRIKNDTLKKEHLRKIQSEAGKKSANKTNSKHKKLWTQFQEKINNLLCNGKIKSYNGACEHVAKELGVNVSTVKRRTINPKAKHK